MDLNSGIAFRTIGVAVGRGDSSMQALKWTLEYENLRPGDTLHLLHVYSPGPFEFEYADPAAVRKFQEKRKVNVGIMITRYIRVCHENQVMTEVHYGESDAVAEELVRLIRKFRITRIVIGPSKTNLLAKLTKRGDGIASYVSKHTEQDCEVVRLRRSRQGRILVVFRPIAIEGKTSFDDMATAYTSVLNLSRSPLTEIADTLPRSRSFGKEMSTLIGYGANDESYAKSTHRQIDCPSPACTSQTKLTGDDRELSESELDMTTASIPPPGVGISDHESNTETTENGVIQSFPHGYMSPAPANTQPIEPIDDGKLIVDQDPLVPEIRVPQNEIDQATFPIAPATLDQVKDFDHAHTFVVDAEKIIVESERQRRDALREAEAAKLQWLEAARKCQELSKENEALRKDCESKVDALTNAIEGYKRDETTAGKQVKDERRRCEELQKRVEKLSSELEKETRKRKEAEERASEESAMKEEALAELRKARQKYTEFSLRELEIATNNFEEGNKLGEGGYGPVFKGNLLHIPVAVKVMTREGVHGREEFEREVELLNNLHHPHLVMLMGACPERACIVYEYMSNGSLEDRLGCKGGTPALPWFVRFRICAEVATALLFLHTRPVPIVHRDMKPANILLDQNYVSKIGDVGIAKLVSSQELDTTAYHQEGSVLKGTMTYMDPDYQRTGIVTCKSDVYALGIVMLRLLTGSRAFGVAAMVEVALEREQLHRVLDRKAGEWPLDEASCLARISLQCAEPKTRDRPDLEMVVLPILERLRAYADQTASQMVSSRSTPSDSHPLNTNLSFSSHSRTNPFHLGGRRSG